MNDAQKGFLRELWGDPRFADLLNEIEIPEIPPYKPSKCPDPDKAAMDWAYWSGRWDQYNRIMEFMGKD